MIKFEDGYIPEEMSIKNKEGQIYDWIPCGGDKRGCEARKCMTCVITKVFDEYAELTGQVESL